MSLSTFGQDQAQPRRYIQKWQLKLTLEKNQAVCSSFRDSKGVRVGFAEEAELRNDEVCGPGVPLWEPVGVRGPGRVHGAVFRRPKDAGGSEDRPGL